jgi:hypothetical protein
VHAMLEDPDTDGKMSVGECGLPHLFGNNGWVSLVENGLVPRKICLTRGNVANNPTLR